MILSPKAGLEQDTGDTPQASIQRCRLGGHPPPKPRPSQSPSANKDKGEGGWTVGREVRHPKEPKWEEGHRRQQSGQAREGARTRPLFPTLVHTLTEQVEREPQQTQAAHPPCPEGTAPPCPLGLCAIF